MIFIGSFCAFAAALSAAYAINYVPSVIQAIAVLGMVITVGLAATTAAICATIEVNKK